MNAEPTDDGESDMIDDIFLARQPILDEDRNTFGYELLYRSRPGDSASFADPDAATQSVVEHTLLDWGIDRVVGERFGFINSGPSIFSSGMYKALPPEGIVIEVRATGPVDDETAEALTQARRDGYHIALDDVSSAELVRTSRVLEHASMLKIDVTATPPAEVREIIEFASRVKPDLKFIAEKVETHAQFEECVEAGFHLFQGYFFAKPQVLSRRSRPANAVSALALLAEVQKPEIQIPELEDLVGSDATLAFRMLGVVNSCAFGLGRRVSSLRQAMILLGLKQVRNLAMLMTLSATDNASSELITLGAARARLASALTPESDGPEAAFTVGLLSVTDSLYGTPMEELLAELPVDAAIAEALLDGTGQLGRTLDIVLAAERGDYQRLEEMVGEEDLGHVLALQAEALAWADSLRSEIGSKPSKVRIPGLKPMPAPEEAPLTGSLNGPNCGTDKLPAPTMASRRDFPAPTLA